MNLEAQAKAYQQFFYQSEAGKTFMDMIHSLERTHIQAAQKHSDLNELNMSAGNRQIIDHIDTVIASVQVPRQDS